MQDGYKKGNELMLIAILVILIIIMGLMVLNTFMIAAITAEVTKPKEKTLEEAQAELFKAWGDKVTNNK